MKILVITPYFFPAEFFGGPVKIAFDIGKELVRKGNEVVVYTSDAKDMENRISVRQAEIEGMKIHYFRNTSMFLVKSSKLFITPELFANLQKDLKSFDIIHAHEYSTYQNILLHKLCKKYSVPYVIQAHGSLPKIGRPARKWFYDAFFGSKLLKDASKVIALNKMEVHQYRLAGVPFEKIALVPNGIDLSQFAKLPSKGCFRKKFGIDENKRIILYLGRLNKIKGIDVLISAFASIVKKIDNVVLIIAGPDDGYLLEIENLVRLLKLKDNVLIVGPLYGMAKLAAYVDADIYVLPSTYETFPVTILEAYACSKPVIASMVGNLNDLVLDGVTGLLVEPRSVNKLSNSILSLLNDPQKKEQMGLNGKRLVYENFTTEKVADKLQSIYNDIVYS